MKSAWLVLFAFVVVSVIDAQPPDPFSKAPTMLTRDQLDSVQFDA